MANREILNLIVQKARQFAAARGRPEQADAFARVAVAIAYGESGLDPTEERNTLNNPNDPLVRSGAARPERSVGLFQNNMAGGRGSGYTYEQLIDPVLSIDISLPALWSAFQQQGGAEAFVRDPIAVTSATYKYGQGSVWPDVATQVNPGLALTQEGGPAQEWPAWSGTVQQHNPAQNTYTPQAPQTQLPTTVDAARSLIQQRIIQAATSQSPDAQAQVFMLSSSLKALDSLRPGQAYTLMDGTQIDIPPDLLAQLNNQAALKVTDILEERDRLIKQQAFTAWQNELNRAQSAQQFGQRLGFDYASLTQTAEQFYARLSQEDRHTLLRLAQSDNQFAQSMGLDRDKLALATRAQDFTEKSFWAQFGGTPLQWASHDLAVRTQEDANRIQQAGVDIDREQLDFEKYKYAQDVPLRERQFAIQERQALAQERNTYVSGLVDLLSAQVSSGALTVRMAEKAMDTMLKVWQDSHTGYMEGFEPGGAQQYAAQALGMTNFSPENYRIRPFPVDLQAMVRAGQQFNFSDAWNKAKEMMAGLGVVTPGTGQSTPAPGQTPGQTPMPGGMGQPGAAPTGMPPAPPTMAGVGVPAASPTPQSPAVPGAGQPPAPSSGTTPLGLGAPQPSSMTPSQPPMNPTQQSITQGPPQCGPGYEPTWTAGGWICTAQGT